MKKKHIRLGNIQKHIRLGNIQKHIRLGNIQIEETIRTPDPGI